MHHPLNPPDHYSAPSLRADALLALPAASKNNLDAVAFAERASAKLLAVSSDYFLLCLDTLHARMFARRTG